MSHETEPSVTSHTQPSPPLTGRAFDPQVPIIRSTTRVIGALVFGHHFLSEEPIFLELIQAINHGLAFVSTIWRRVIGSWGGWCVGHGTIWIQFRQELPPGSGWNGKKAGGVAGSDSGFLRLIFLSTILGFPHKRQP